jgi:tripartite-type tricarboxylate transporter receptor subunit TctC
MVAYPEFHPTTLRFLFSQEQWSEERILMICRRSLYATIAGLVLGIAIFLGWNSAAIGQQYPTKPVRIIVPYVPGGGYDAVARLIAARLTDYLGQQFVVDNRGGASGTVGTEMGVRAAPDGYTLTLIGAGYSVNAALYPLNFDPVYGITPIAQIATGPYLVVVHPSIPGNTLAALIAYARSKPGQLNYANSGSTVYMATELFLNMANLKMTSIPYKGTGPAMIDTIAGHTAMFFASITSALPHVKSGRLRGLAITTAERLAAEPDIPTIAESGFPGYDVPNWYGLIGPQGLSPSIVDRLNSLITKAIAAKDVEELLQHNGTRPVGGNPKLFLQQIRKEIDLWRQVAKQSGIKMQL